MGSLGDFLSLIPLPAHTAPSLKLELQSVRVRHLEPLLLFQQGWGSQGEPEDLHPSRQEAPGVYSHTTTNVANLD